MLLRKNIYKLIILFLALIAVGILSYFFIFLPKQKETLLKAADTQIIVSLTLQEKLAEVALNENVNSLSKEQLLGSTFMIAIPETQLSTNTIEFINKNHIGGVIIMGNNVVSETQLKNLLSDLRTKSDHPILISVDQEGYPVARIPWDKYAKDSAKYMSTMSLSDIQKTMEYRAKLLKELGFNMNFAPVVDLATTKSAIGIRSFGTDANKVAAIVTIIMKTFAKENVIATAKHFPGLGSSQVDSHTGLPVNNSSKEQLLNYDLLPYKELISADIQAIMVGHGLYTAIDNKNPASLSPEIYTLLKKELGFEGLIVTDDMKMGALPKTNTKFATALNSGADLLIYVVPYSEVESAINATKSNVSSDLLKTKVKKIVSLAL